MVIFPQSRFFLHLMLSALGRAAGEGAWPSSLRGGSAIRNSELSDVLRRQRRVAIGDAGSCGLVGSCPP